MTDTLRSPTARTTVLAVTPAAKTATGASAGVDMTDAEGLASFHVAVAKGTGNADNTADFTVESADDSGFSTNLTVEPISGQVQVLGTGGVDKGMAISFDAQKSRKFARLKWTLAGTTPSFIIGALLSYEKKYR
jgi:hypothetical protein